MATLVMGFMTQFYVPPGSNIRATRAALEAMNHPTRQRILAVLLGEPEGLPYGEIASRLGFEEPSSIDQHIKLLVRAILVANYLSRVDGRIRSIYKISAWGVQWMERCEFTDPAQLKLLLGPARSIA
jgi:DNA-binding transcriptional ArsR family regulator